MGKGQWNPWAGVDELRQRMDKLLEDALRDMTEAANSGSGYLWSPPADVYETPTALVARLDLPGISADQLVLEWADGELLVRGERAADLCENPQTDECAFLLMERPHGPFSRRFPLPQDADPEGITATLRDGVLTIIVPRCQRPNSGPRRVCVG